VSRNGSFKALVICLYAYWKVTISLHLGRVSFSICSSLAHASRLNAANRPSRPSFPSSTIASCGVSLHLFRLCDAQRITYNVFTLGAFVLLTTSLLGPSGQKVRRLDTRTRAQEVEARFHPWTAMSLTHRGLLQLEARFLPLRCLWCKHPTFHPGSGGIYPTKPTSVHHHNHYLRPPFHSTLKYLFMCQCAVSPAERPPRPCHP
jgi:hypothetical protein